jgi:diguanylate cyclase (GGDEF)-like protein/PAS domain S-box-containing protein
VFLKDTQGRYVLINAAGARLLGKTPDEIIGRDDAALTTAEIARQIRAADHIVLRTGSAHTHEETLLVNGAPRVFLANKAPYRDADGNIVGLIGIARDISERKQAEETIRSLSLTDELTGLHNRRGLLTLARPALELATRNRHRVFLFFIDLDGMKGINDRFGHEQGDQALRDAAAVLRATFRESDILARLGGDELVVLALETRAEDPETLSARLQQAVDQHNDRAGRVYHLALSIGTVAAHPDGRVTIEELLTQADMAMYQQKLQRKLALA